MKAMNEDNPKAIVTLILAAGFRFAWAIAKTPPYGDANEMAVKEAKNLMREVETQAGKLF